MKLSSKGEFREYLLINSRKWISTLTFRISWPTWIQFSTGCLQVRRSVITRFVQICAVKVVLYFRDCTKFFLHFPRFSCDFYEIQWKICSHTWILATDNHALIRTVNVHIYRPIRVKVGSIRYLHITSMICDFLKNRLKEGRAFHIGVHEIMPVYLKTHCLMEYIPVCYKLSKS